MGKAKRWDFLQIFQRVEEKRWYVSQKAVIVGGGRKASRKSGDFSSIIGDLHYFLRLEWVMMATHDNDMITFFLFCMSSNCTYKYTTINHSANVLTQTISFLLLLLIVVTDGPTILHNVNATSCKIFRLEMYWTKSWEYGARDM